MDASGAKDTDVLVCPRPGCRDTVRNVRALIYHLHMHSVGDKGLSVASLSFENLCVDPDASSLTTIRKFNCSDCDRGFETRKQLGKHACPFRCRSAPSSPILRALLLRLSSFFSYGACRNLYSRLQLALDTQLSAIYVDFFLNLILLLRLAKKICSQFPYLIRPVNT
jgi:hypothetical protein